MRGVGVRRVSADSEEIASDVLYYVRVEADDATHHVVALVDAADEVPRAYYLELDVPSGDSGDRLLAFSVKTELETRLEATLRALKSRPLATRRLPSLSRTAPPPASAPTSLPSSAPASASLPVEPQLPPPRWWTCVAIDARAGFAALGVFPFANLALGGRLTWRFGLEAQWATQVALTSPVTLADAGISYTLVSQLGRVGYGWRLAPPLWISAGGQAQLDVHIASRSGVRTSAGVGGGAGAYARLRWQPWTRPVGLLVDGQLIGQFASALLVSDSDTQRRLVPLFWSLTLGVDVEFGQEP